MGALPKTVGNCPTCRPLNREARRTRSDLVDVKRKLQRAQTYDNEALYLDQVPALKARAKAADQEYLAHHAEAHPDAGHGRPAFATAGEDYVHERADLPPAAQLVGLLDDGWTRAQIAEHYRCSESTVSTRLQMSGLLDTAPEPSPVVDVGLDTDWQVDALCTQTDPEAFFPEKGESHRAAKRTCMACPVRNECLEHALATRERWGVWGGLGERERRKILQDRRNDLALDERGAA